MTTAFITHADCAKHDMGRTHPESPARLAAIEDHLVSSGLAGLIERHEAPAAKVSELARVHPLQYIEAIHQASPRSGIVHLDPDTAMCPHTWDAALHAAGAAVLATDLVIGARAENAFCAVRPPGHHATRTRAMGFCLFNNVAVGVAHALAAHGIERAAVVDFDVHHGNGTEDIFAGSAGVIMVGTFQYPLYPYSGVEPLGANMHNVPLSPGSGSGAFRAAITERCLPALEAHRPEILFVSAGFDAHREDPLANLELADADFAWVTSQIVAVAARHAQGRIVSSHEGGYALPALGRSAIAHLRGLAAA